MFHIGFDYRTVRLDTPGRKDKAIHIPGRDARCEMGKILSFKVQGATNPTPNPSQYVLASFQLISQAIRLL